MTISDTHTYGSSISTFFSLLLIFAVVGVVALDAYALTTLQ
jgi:hypothetical protein